MEDLYSFNEHNQFQNQFKNHKIFTVHQTLSNLFKYNLHARTNINVSRYWTFRLRGITIHTLGYLHFCDEKMMKIIRKMKQKATEDYIF